MTHLIRTIASLLVLISLAGFGCDHEGASHSHAGDANHTGPDHADTADAGHDDHDHDDGGHSHGVVVSLGVIEIGGAELEVKIPNEFEPGGDVPVELVLTGGTSPSAIRLWIGDEGATGALKSKAEGDSDYFHAHLVAPQSLDGAAFWIEVETADGTRMAQSLPLER